MLEARFIILKGLFQEDSGTFVFRISSGHPGHCSLEIE